MSCIIIPNLPPFLPIIIVLSLTLTSVTFGFAVNISGNFNIISESAPYEVATRKSKNYYMYKYVYIYWI